MDDTNGRVRGLGTTEVSVATGYSVQQVRDLEAAGVIGPAPRARNGYRRFTADHVRDLGTYRRLAMAVGPAAARRVMREIRSLSNSDAAALVCSLHSQLNRVREHALLAKAALEAISAEADYEAAPRIEDSMTITELAGALDIRTSKLRFWQKEGLVAADRVTTKTGSARRYPLQAIREARITAALRGAGYRIPEVREAIDAVRNLDSTDQSLEALAGRIEAIGQRSLTLLQAGAGLAEIVASAPPHS